MMRENDFAKRREEDLLKRRTRTRTRSLIKSGAIDRRHDCERCGAPEAQVHHEDYRDPGAIMWLCSRCHGLRHRELNAAGITPPVSSEPIPPSTRGRTPRLEKPVRCSFQIEEPDLSAALAIAQERDCHVSAVVREALREYLSRQKRASANRAS